MTGKRRRRIPAAAAIVLCILAASVTVSAAVKYLSVNQVAEELAQPEIQKAFQSKGAIEVNKTKEAGDYRFTFLGIASGEAITESDLDAELPADGDEIDETAKNEQTYAVLAIERKDGKPMPKISDDAYGDKRFCVSPLIEGLDPLNYNIAYMGGGYSDVWKDGVIYRIMDSDELEKFADRNVYLSITDSVTFDNSAFDYDKKTGAITENKDYDGINLLFKIPYDKSKADPEAAEKYLKELEESEEESEEEMSEAPSAKEIRERAELVEDSVQEVKEENGAYVYKYKTGIECTVNPEYDFPNGKTGWSDSVMWSEDDSERSYVLFYKNADGKIMGSIYREEK